MDIICIGNATRDVFVHLRQGHKCSNKVLCLEEGSKQEVDKIKYDTGGGAVNSAVALSRLGLKTGILAAVGRDDSGKAIIQELRKEKISTALLKKLDYSTAYSAIVTGKGFDRIIFTYGGATSHLEALSASDWKLLEKADWFHVSSFHSRPKLLSEIFSFAKKKKKKISFNPGRSELAFGFEKLKPLISKSDVFFVNLAEARMLLGKKSVKEMLEIFQQYSSITVITAGKKGVHCFDGKKHFFKNTYSIGEVDTTGAGDAFNSGFTAALVFEKEIEDAMSWGMAEAQSVIEHLGAKEKLLSRNSLLKYIKQHE